ncbi:MAG: TlpA family protein disulfide reductase [Tepidisphaeraceae bacterium]
MKSRFTLTASALLMFAGLSLAGGKPGGDTASLVGKPAPQFQAETLDGQSVSLAGEKGNVVLMDFWASWCPPCRASLPHIQEFADDKELAQKGLKVWAVSTNWRGETKEKAAAFVKQNNYTFTVPIDAENAASNKFLATGIPTTVLIGRDGTVQKVWVGFDKSGVSAMRQAIESALDQG